MSTKKKPAAKPAPKAPAKKPAAKPAPKAPAKKPAAKKPAAKPATPAPVAKKTNGAKHITRTKSPTSVKMKHPTKAGSLMLTELDVKLLRAVMKGTTFVALGNELGREPGTLRVDAHRLYKKIGVDSQVQAAVWASRYLEDAHA
jgi:DNA-binding CsgD family transcriptional regulator